MLTISYSLNITFENKLIVVGLLHSGTMVVNVQFIQVDVHTLLYADDKRLKWMTNEGTQLPWPSIMCSSCLGV